jgi:branched-subunit amino acid transport protein AzlD
MLSSGQALFYSLLMGLVILVCRALPFILFHRTVDEKARGNTRGIRFLSFVERVLPPIAMTVLAFNAITSPVRENPEQVLPALLASLFTALAHLWKRNSLLSIAGGTALYMMLRAWF